MKANTSEVVGQFIGIVFLVPLLMTIMWNYGATDVIDALGGPNADVNLIQGWLAVLFFGGVASIFKRTV